MLAIRLLPLALLLAARVCWAQEITEPGWFNANEGIASEPGGEGGASSGPLDIQGGPPIAEALTPEIEALARGLENDPVRIYNYVHDHIRHVFYYGAKKGAQLTLLERSGNDFDQCALLVALLRAAGYTDAAYQFGLLKMPYDSADHNDLKHWLQLSLVNTNWTTTLDYFGYLLGTRGYPNYAWWSSFGDNNTMAFHRVWVKLPIGGTDYLLDPAFKVSEPVPGMDWVAGMGFNSNDVWSAAGGTVTADYVQNINEAPLRDKLRDYTTNVLGWLQSNVPNASVEEILGGWRIVPSSNSALSESLLFASYDNDGKMPVLNWANQPTNLMSRLTIAFAATNHQWLLPQLGGQRLSMTFDSNGVARLWQDDTLLVEKATSGSGVTLPVTLSVNHPHGDWNTTANTFTDKTRNDQSDQSNPALYQRTNSTYAILYAFETGPSWLRQRQDRLDAYRQQGLEDTSREVICETLNVMGLGWMEQSELTGQLVARHGDILWQNHHRLGRMSQEQGKGYYVDVYLQWAALRPANGNTPEDQKRNGRVFDLSGYFISALEHAIIEQLHSTNLVAASTIKMLQLGNTNSLKVFLANSSNWTLGTNIRGQLTNYGLGGLDSYINAGFTLLLPRDGAQYVAGAGTWRGYGLVARLVTANYSTMSMLIGGNYNGGYSSSPTATVNPPYVSQTGYSQPAYFDPNGAFTWTPSSAEPVRLSDGAYELAATDISVGQPEPRGLAFSRSYNSARRRLNLAGIAHGWTHNYFFRLAETSAAGAGLGQTTPAQMAPMLVATRVAFELYNATSTDPKNWLLTALIAKWGVDQLINNAVSVTLGEDTVQFVRQPDGRLTPPANCTMTLGKTNSAYNLWQRHGNTFMFASDRRLTNIVDQYGKGLALSYNASNWVTQAKDWKNRTLTLNYSGTPSRLTSISDGTRTVTYGYSTAYSAQGDLASITDPESKTSALVYDANHQIVAVMDALNQTTVSNVYDGFGRTIEQYNQGDPAKLWRFYWSGFVNTEEDPTGARRRFFFDEKSRAIGQQDALGNASSTYYDGQNHVVATVTPLNEVTGFQFDGRHNLVRSIDPLDHTNTFNFDAQDRLTSVLDARGNVSSFGYNAKFQVIGSTNGAGDWTTFDYNAADGTLASRADAAGTTTFHYDTQGYLSGITHPGSLGAEGLLNNTYGDVLTRTNARGFRTTFQYNARRQLISSTAPTNLTVNIAYDAVGNPQSSTDARGFTTTSFWSPTRKPLGIVLPATPQGAPATTNLYDARDWLESSRNPLQQTTRFTNDAAERLVAVTDPLLRPTWLGYDANGRQTSATNAALEVTRQVWDARGQLLQTLTPQLTTINRGYDAAANQVYLTNRNGKLWEFQFDTANRLTSTITPLGRETRVVYDNRGLPQTVREPSTQTATHVYDARGRLLTRMDDVGSTVFDYDANNNVTNVIEAGKTNAWAFDAYDRVSTYRDAEGNLIQYRHDQNGNVTNLVYPGGKNVYYAYDSLNRLTNVTDWANRKTSLEYDLASRLKKIARPNGTARETNYDPAGQTTNLWERTAAGVPIAMFKFNWNNAARVEWEFAAPLPHAYSPPTRTMTFDDDNRIATFNGQSVVHDLDGNMTSGPLTNNSLAAYTYDARNRLLSAGGFSYAYDPSGNRVGMTNGADVTRFVVNPNAALSQVLIRTKPDGSKTFYVYGAGLLYEVNETSGGTETGTATYHFDYRGSTVALTDGSGTVTDRIEHSPYGTTTYRTGNTDTPFLFNGRYGVQTDPNGLLHMRARYYNAYLYRFINADPIGFEGGLNFYAYADGNPISMIDPFGLGAGEVGGGTSWLNRGWEDFTNRLEQRVRPNETPAWTHPISTAVGSATILMENLGGFIGWAESQMGIPQGASTFLPLIGQEQLLLRAMAAKTGIPRNAAVFEIETQGGMLTRDGRILQSGAVKSRTDFLNQTPVRRVDFDHTHGNLGAPHVNDLHVNPNNPSLINAGRPRLPEPGEYLSPVLSDPRIQGGVFRP